VQVSGSLCRHRFGFLGFERNAEAISPSQTSEGKRW
jgi:hypothetical protein